MSTPNALHSAKTPRWGTPAWLIELARKLLGYIHLDPASSIEFNFLVKALMVYTEKDNGLAPECLWAGNIFLNPPGGLVLEFWNKLCKSYLVDKSVDAGFWVGFSVEQLCTLASETYHPSDFSMCVLRKRLNFNREDLQSGQSPSHGNYICAMGVDHAEFEKLFAPYGKVTRGKLSLDISKPSC